MTERAGCGRARRRALGRTAVLVAVALAASACSGGGDSKSGRNGASAIDRAAACPDGSVLRCPARAANAQVPVAGTGLTLVYRSEHRDQAAPSALGGWFLAGYDHLDVAAKVVITGDGEVRRVEPVDGASGEHLVPSADGASVAVFDASGAQQRTVDAFTGIDLVRYRHENGKLVEVAPRSAPATTIERDEQGRPLAFVAAGGLRTVLVLDEAGWLTTTRDPLGTGWHMTYADGGDGLLSAVADDSGAGPAFTYDGDGFLSTSVDADGVTTTWSGDSTDDQTVVVATSPSGVRTTWTDHRDGDARTITVERDGGDKLTEDVGADGSSRIVLADGTEVRREVEPDPRWSGAVTRLVAMHVTTPGGRTVAVTQHAEVKADQSDPLAVVTATRTLTSGATTTSTAWDGAGHVLTGTDGRGLTTRARLDDHGQLVEASTDGQGTIAIERDDQGRPTAVHDGRGTTTIAYAADEASVVLTDPMGGQWQVGVDAAGRLTSVLDPSGRRTLLDRTTGGLPISVGADGDQVHGWAWTRAGRPAGRTGPYQELVAADEDGRASTITSGADGKVSLGYDKAGDLATIGLVTDAVKLDRSPGALQLTAQDAGAVVDVKSDGPLVERIEATGPIDGAVALTYDDAFRLATLDIAGSTLAIKRDDGGRVTAVGDLALTWDGVSRVATTELGAVSSVRAYDSVGALASEEWTVSGAPYAALGIVRDALGRATSETTAGTTRTFTYDAAGRVDGAADPSAAWAYTWDRHDDLTSITGPAGAEQLTYDDRDRLIARGQTTYTWRDDGALTGWTDPSGTTTLTVDDLGRATGVELPDGRSIRYLLDGAGRRVAREVDGKIAEGYLYDHGRAPVALVGADGKVTQRYVRTDPGAPAFIVTDTATYRVVTDHRGSPRAVIDIATGAVVQELDYDPLGRVIRDTNPGFQPFGFGGGVLDRDTGLVHLGARDYDPASGRFTAPDPALLAGGQLNPYAFADGDPVNFVDPGGQQASPAAGSADPTGGLPDLAGLINGVVNSGSLSQGIASGIAAGKEVRSFGDEGDSKIGDIGDAADHLGTAGEQAGRFSPGIGGALGGIGKAVGTAGGIVGAVKTAKDLGVGGGKGSPGEVFDDVKNTMGALEGVAPWAAEAFGLVFSAYVFGRLVPQAFGDDTGSYGDPHLTTHDGRRYDFQGAGEFVAVADDEGDFEVQARQQPPKTTRAVTLNTALAVRVGTDRVTLDRSGAIAVGGVPVTDPTSRIGLPGGGSILRRVDGSVVVQHADGTTAVHVTFRGDHLDYTIGLAPTRAGHVHGLFGNADGNPDDDIMSRDGTAVAPTRADPAEPLYATFGESWRVPVGGSLFDYADGTSPDTYTDRTIPDTSVTVDENADVTKRAKVLCTGGGVTAEPFLGNCVLDVVVSGDPGFVPSAAAAQLADARARAQVASAAAGGQQPSSGGGTIKVGQDVEGRVTSKTEEKRYQFVAKAGDKVLLAPGGLSPCTTEIRLESKSNAPGPVDGCHGQRIDFPTTDTYTFVVHDSTGDGHYKFRLDDVPEPKVASIKVGDTVTGRLARPGEQYHYTFDADAGDAVFVGGGRDSACEIGLDVLGPDGKRIVNGGDCGGIGRVILPSTGTYRVVIAAPYGFTGDYALSLLESSPDEHFDIELGQQVGPGQPGGGAGRIDRPGGYDLYAFTGHAGRTVTIHGTGPTCFGARPADSNGFIGSLLSVCGDWAFVVPIDGRIELHVGSGDLQVGDYSFRLDET